MTDIKIFKGNQVGGNTTMIISDQTKIVIDYGEDLPGTEPVEEFSIDWENEKVDAVFFTHYHGDHIGRFVEIPENIPIYMSGISQWVLKNHYEKLRKDTAIKRLDDKKNIILLKEKETVTVKDISVTPYRVDHSAFFSFMFLIETPSKTILHTGDYRDQGHNGNTRIDGKGIPVIVDTIKKDIKQGINRTIDVLITEGTMIGARRDLPKYTEWQMKEDLCKLFEVHKHVFLVISSTNADSLYSFYSAAKTHGMGFYADDRVLDLLKAFYTDWAFKRISVRGIPFFPNLLTSYPLLKKSKNENVSEKYLRAFSGQRKHMRNEGFVAVVSYKDEEILEEFADLNPILIYSMWPGYINEEVGKDAYSPELAAFCKRHNAINMHVGGHAYPDLIAAVIEATAPMESIIPIHTDNPEGFLDLPINEKYKKKVKLMNKKNEQDLQRLYELNESAAQYYRKRLKKKFGQQGRDLLKTWRITDETINDYGLGYSGKSKDSLVRHLKKLGYTDTEIVIAGLANTREGVGITDRFNNRIMFPIKDEERRVVGFAGRAVGDGQPIYLVSHSSPIFDKDKTLFGIDKAEKLNNNYLIICEGYLDVLVLHQNEIGIPVAPCTLGAISPDHAEIIGEYSRRAAVCFDNDNIGCDNSKLSQERLENEGCKTARVDVSPYRDLVDYIWGEGTEAFKKLVAETFQNLI